MATRLGVKALRYENAVRRGNRGTLLKQNQDDPEVQSVPGLQGGAISYAAAVASAYGIRACVVTAAGPDADLSVFRGHDLHVIPTNNTLTFEHSYTWWGEVLTRMQTDFLHRMHKCMAS